MKQRLKDENWKKNDGGLIQGGRYEALKNILP